MESANQPPAITNGAAHKKQGNSHLQNGELAEAAECYRRAVLADPGDASAHVNLGFALRELQLFEDAERSLRQAAAMDPNNADAHYLLGTLENRKDNLEEAIRHFNRALELQPELEVAYEDLFEVLIRIGQAERATELISRAISLWPKAANFRYLLGNQFALRKDYAASAACHREALNLNPDYPEAHNNLGCALENLDCLDEAAASYERAIELHPNYFAALMNLGSLLLRQKRLLGAQSTYERAIRLEPHRSTPYARLATTLQMQGKYQEAIVCLRQAVSCGPDDADAHSRLGAALQNQDRFDEAILSFQRALTIDPDFLHAHLGLGGAYLKLSKEEEALQSFRQAVRLAPGHPASHIVEALSGANSERAPGEYIERLFDGYADTFDADLVEKLQYNIPNALLNLVEEAANPQPGQWRILDLGCGTGQAGAAFAMFSKEMVGVDLSSKMLGKAALRNVYQRLEKKDLLEAMRAEETATYDLVIATDVFVYIGKLDEVVGEAKRILCARGLIAFSVEDIELPSDTHLSSKESPDFQLKRSVRYGHSVAYLRRLATDHNFDILRMDPVQIRMDGGRPVNGHVAVWVLSGTQK